MDLYDVPSQCEIVRADVTLSAGPSGVTENTTLVVRANAPCGTIGVVLPAEVAFVGGEGRRYGVKRKSSIPADRWEVGPRDLKTGATMAVLYVPELDASEVMDVQFERRWASFQWTPADDGVERLELHLAGVEGTYGDTAIGAARPDIGVDGPKADARVSVGAAREVAVNPLEGTIGVDRKLKVVVGAGRDPMRALFPGGGSRLETTETLTIGAKQHGSWTVPIPLGAAPTVITDPPAAGVRVDVLPDAAVVHIDPAESERTVTLAWSTKDAPTCGEQHARPGEDFSWSADAPGGHIERDGDFWTLTDLFGLPVTPSRERVIEALDYRFRASAFPEPGLPNELRGKRTDPAVLELLVPLLWQRTRVGELPYPTTWPRSLKKSMGDGALSPLEGALTIMLYAQQAGFPATWVMVRPNVDGPASALCPDIYRDAVVRVVVGDKDVWLDPGCRSCASNELRPSVSGAWAYGLGVEKTPDASGTLTIRAVGGTVTVDLVGPPAIELREWLATVPKDDRAAAIAERYAGKGATLATSDGLGAAGKPIHLEIAGGASVDPLVLDGDFEWLGTVTITRDGGALDPRVRERREVDGVDVDVVRLGEVGGAVAVDLGPVSYLRHGNGDGSVEEQLVVRERAVTPEVVAGLAAARTRVGGPAEAAPEPFAGVSGTKTKADGVEVEKGTLATVLGVDGDQAIVRIGDTVAKSPRTDWYAVPFRAGIASKAATVPLRADPAPKGRVVEQFPVAGDAVFVTEIKGSWARIDVEGPLSPVRRTGWLPLELIAPLTPGEPVQIGDLPLSAWTTALRSPGEKLAVTEVDISLRGSKFPKGTVLELADGGRIAAVLLPSGGTVGKEAFPAGARLVLVESCAFQVDGVCVEP